MDEPPIDNIPAALEHLRHISVQTEEFPYTAPAATLVLDAVDRVMALCKERAMGMLTPSDVLAAWNGRRR